MKILIMFRFFNIVISMLSLKDFQFFGYDIFLERIIMKIRFEEMRSPEIGELVD